MKKALMVTCLLSIHFLQGSPGNDTDWNPPQNEVVLEQPGTSSSFRLRHIGGWVLLIFILLDPLSHCYLK